MGVSSVVVARSGLECLRVLVPSRSAGAARFGPESNLAVAAALVLAGGTAPERGLGPGLARGAPVFVSTGRLVDLAGFTGERSTEPRFAGAVPVLLVGSASNAFKASVAEVAALPAADEAAADMLVAHLPDKTPCAASRTPSAISVPSLDAMDIIAVAALEAPLATSSPASRIFRCAIALAANDAAAAVNPAVSISRPSAAFAELSVALPLLALRFLALLPELADFFPDLAMLVPV